MLRGVQHGDMAGASHGHCRANIVDDERDCARCGRACALPYCSGVPPAAGDPGVLLRTASCRTLVIP